MSVKATGAGARRRSAFDLQAYLASRTARVNQALDEFLPKETTRPATIHQAMRYSLFAGGKRLRPTLVLLASRLGPRQDPLRSATLAAAFCFCSSARAPA